MRDLLLVELLGEVGRRIELRQDVVNAGKLVAAQVVVAAQRAAHLVEVAVDLLERLLQAGEQPHALHGVRHEVLGAELLERLRVSVLVAPALAHAPYACLDRGAMRIAVVGLKGGGGAGAGFGEREGGRAVGGGWGHGYGG